LMGILNRAGKRHFAVLRVHGYIARRTEAAIGQFHLDICRDFLIRASGTHVFAPGTSGGGRELNVQRTSVTKSNVSGRRQVQTCGRTRTYSAARRPADGTAGRSSSIARWRGAAWPSGGG